MMKDLFFYEYFQFSEYTNFVVPGVVGILCIFVTLPSFAFVYKKIRSKFPITVNCWFCNKNTKVAFNDANCWDCPHCDQYNGFNKDGGYNKVIQEQHLSSCNSKVFTAPRTNSKADGFKNEASNGFCKLCNINQQLKIQQLALFTPLNENNFDEEINLYRQKLEKSYRLCTKCEITLQQTLQKKQYNLLTDRLNNQKTKPDTSPIKGIDFVNNIKWFYTLKRTILGTLRWTSLLISIWLLLVCAVVFETEHEIWKPSSKNWILQNLNKSTVQIILNSIRISNYFKKELTTIGLICSSTILGIRRSRTEKIESFNLLLWILLLLVAWTDFNGLRLLLCATSLFINSQIVQSRRHYFYKNNLNKKTNLQAEKTNFTPPYSSMNTSEFKPSRKKPIVQPNLDCNETLFNSESCEKDKNREEEVMNSSTSEPQVPQLPQISQTQQIPQKPQKSKPKASTPPGKQSSIFSKSFLAELESEAVEKDSTSPPEEIYNNLNSLYLGTKTENSNKPSNFLFENHDFIDRTKRNSSIIKPAKFVKNLGSSWTSGEVPDSVSRSSTPSSGYSSLRTEKSDYLRGSLPYTKAISPVNPFGRVTPDNFDYYDENPNLYNQLNYFSPGFVPFQHFPGAIGHTTVYTYTRPSNFPYAFPPSPSQNFSYSPKSRFSDVSDTENIFQNTSQNFQQNRKWLKFKSIFYNASIFLNLFTVVVLIYCLCSGLILIDWKLPIFNFN